jgi:ligand-binding sensor domain-containing protein
MNDAPISYPFVAVFLSALATAQSPMPESRRIIHQSWTFKEGAPESVQALAQTTDGYLWLGTPFGLYRFGRTLGWISLWRL